MLEPSEIINVILHVVFISSFIGLFFFTYGAIVEEAIVKKQTQDIIKSFTQDMNALMTPEQKSSMKILTNASLQSPDMQQQDAQVEDDNKNLIMLSVKYIGILFLIATAVIVALIYFTEFTFKDLGTLLIKNLIILSFVALTEFSFLTYIVQNYIDIDANYVKYTIMKTLKNYATN
jgi:hypothetical protein